ncbi:unnamed protein product [Choristocarpus tenellus]
MKEVGFWNDPRNLDDLRPDPRLFVDESWGSKSVEVAAVILYIKTGYIESFELGYSFCRFGCGLKDEVGDTPGMTEMGCCTLTDGEYIWPEGYEHYIRRHAVRPPDTFIHRSLENLKRLQDVQEGGRMRWVEEEGAPAVLDQGTKTFLDERTTLGTRVPHSSKSGLLGERCCLA